MREKRRKRERGVREGGRERERERVITKQYYSAQEHKC